MYVCNVNDTIFWLSLTIESCNWIDFISINITLLLSNWSDTLSHWLVPNFWLHIFPFPEILHLQQYSVLNSKHITSNLHLGPRLFLSFPLLSKPDLILAVFLSSCPIEWHRMLDDVEVHYQHHSYVPLSNPNFKFLISPQTRSEVVKSGEQSIPVAGRSQQGCDVIVSGECLARQSDVHDGALLLWQWISERRRFKREHQRQVCGPHLSNS